MKKMIIIQTHPIQYYAPLFKLISEIPSLDVTVCYFSDASIRGAVDNEFKQKVVWDIPLLEGYKSVFLKNYSKNENTRKLTGMINWGVVPFLFRQPKGIVLIHGWGNLSYLLSILAAKLGGHTLWLRMEQPLIHEQKRSAISRLLRKIIIGWGVCSIFDKFLYIGSQNKKLYNSWGIKDNQMLFAPYCVDNDRFQKQALILSEQKDTIKETLGIKKYKNIFLSAGKYIPVKNPLNLIRVFHQMDNQDCGLVMMGDGPLRAEMEQYISENKIENIILTGFINQTKVAEYYATADVLVMPSVSETWGLSINEAMNFGLPAIISDNAGSAYDLIHSGKNGYIHPASNMDSLREAMQQFIQLPAAERIKMGEYSRNIISEYSYNTIISNIQQEIFD